MPTRAKKSTKKGAETEINRLRAQVKELQAELSGNDSTRNRDRADDDDDSVRNGKYRRVADDATDVAVDLPIRVMDEVSKLARGLTFAYLEQLRISADVLSTFADEVIIRNQADSPSRSRRSSASRDDSDDRDGGRSRRRTITELTTDLPADLSSGFMRALNRSLDMPGAAVDRFYEVYRETEEEAEPSLSRARRTRSNESSRSGSTRSTKASRASRSRRGRARKSPISAARREEPAETDSAAT